MIRFVLRMIGLICLAGSFVFLVYDGTRSIANGSLEMTQVGYIWASIHRDSLLLFQPAVERHLSPWLWQGVIQPYFLEQPIWLVLAIIGAVLILLGRRKRPLIGYAR
jgi:hypothetical protein